MTSLIAFVPYAPWYAWVLGLAGAIALSFLLILGFMLWMDSQEENPWR